MASCSAARICLCNTGSPAARSSTAASASTSAPAAPATMNSAASNAFSQSMSSVAGPTNTFLATTVAASTSSGAISSLQATHRAKGCKQCRAKPKFSFLRSQRSLDTAQGEGAGSPAKEAEARGGGAQGGRGRRTRSAERYEGIRVNDRNAATGLPRQTSLQTPLLTASSAPGPPPTLPVTSPPPSYEVAVGKGGLPPSYDEYLNQRLNETRGGRVTPPPPFTQHIAHTCPCARCKSAARNGRQLRVAMPPESTATTPTTTSSTNHSCPCSKCQPRYSSYSDTANVNTAVLISLDTTTAMHSVLADGIALCNLM